MQVSNKTKKILFQEQEQRVECSGITSSKDNLVGGKKETTTNTDSYRDVITASVSAGRNLQHLQPNYHTYLEKSTPLHAFLQRAEQNHLHTNSCIMKEVMISTEVFWTAGICFILAAGREPWAHWLCLHAALNETSGPVHCLCYHSHTIHYIYLNYLSVFTIWKTKIWSDNNTMKWIAWSAFHAKVLN